MKKQTKIFTAMLAAVMAVGMAGLPLGAAADAAPDTAVVQDDPWDRNRLVTSEDGFIYFPMKDGVTCFIAGYEGTEEDLVLPEKIDGLTVEGIYCYDDNDYGFNGLQNVKSVTIPYGWEYLPGYIFMNCPKLEKVVLSDTITHIGDMAFKNCPKLSDIHFPENLDYVGDAAFLLTKWYDDEYANKDMVIIGGTVVNANKAKGDIVLPDSIHFIQNGAFMNNKEMTSIVIPSSVSMIYEMAFYNCESLEKATLCNGVKSIQKMAFCECPKLKALIIPPSVGGITMKPVSTKYRKKTTIYYYKGSYTEKWLTSKAEVKYKSSVLPGKTKSLKVTPQKKKVKVTWKPVSTASGYQIRISTSKKFDRNTRNKYIKKKLNKTNCTFKNLKSGRKYYIKMRTYRIVGGQEYFGNYTKTRVVTVR